MIENITYPIACIILFFIPYYKAIFFKDFLVDALSLIISGGTLIILSLLDSSLIVACYVLASIQFGLGIRRMWIIAIIRKEDYKPTKSMWTIYIATFFVSILLFEILIGRFISNIEARLFIDAVIGFLGSLIGFQFVALFSTIIPYKIVKTEQKRKLYDSYKHEFYEDNKLTFTKYGADFNEEFDYELGTIGYYLYFKDKVNLTYTYIRKENALGIYWIERHQIKCQKKD